MLIIGYWQAPPVIITVKMIIIIVFWREKKRWLLIMNTTFALHLAFSVDNPNTRILIHKLKDDPDSTIKLLGRSLSSIVHQYIYIY